MMKISLFYKPSSFKVYSFLAIISFVLGTPLGVNASIFSDFTSLVLGTQATATEIAVIEGNGNDAVHNSQTLPLLETSVNPDLHNPNDGQDMIIVQDDSFIYNDAAFGSDYVKFEKSSLSDKILVYTVKEGDTLSEIAEQFDISINTIRWENNMSGDKVSIGQKLNILPVTGVKHTVKKGDTIQGIANKYDAVADDIYIFNDISKESILKIGDIVFVPNGIIKAVVSKTKSTGSSKAVVSNTKVPLGYYIRPVSGIITSSYGSRRGGFHYGVDIGNKRGTPIVAAASGTVVKVISGCAEGRSSCGGRYGNYIAIQHANGTKTIYAHLSKVSVSNGQTVSQGQTIGTVGNTGRSTGPHLHFEIENANGSKMKPPVY